MDTKIKIKPVLDPAFLPASVWNRSYQHLVDSVSAFQPFAIALERPDGLRTVYHTRILPPYSVFIGLNRKYVGRLVKFWLWATGGSKIYLCGSYPELTESIAHAYAPSGSRQFDNEVIGQQIFDSPIKVVAVEYGQTPEPVTRPIPLGRHLDGCRIGFDLGGSDRKCAALIDGKVVHAEEVPWDPYFQTNVEYHLAGIRDSLKRAAAHLPRVDAIGGSSAGVYVNNQVRVASLFRGIDKDSFQQHVQDIFLHLRKEWNNVPFEVVNDGDVTALAGSMSLNDSGVLGLAMGTSEATGYVDLNGHITPNLSELAFAPVDYQLNGPIDEWSGDRGCGVQYFSQQAVARLAPAAGIPFPADMPFPEQLEAVQALMAQDDPRARSIYQTIGTYLGYTLPHYAAFYDIKHLLILGRVTSGEGGEIIIDEAQQVLQAEFPECAEKINIRTPNEQVKRHGQAIAAASLPRLDQEGLSIDTAQSA
ncbi:MAG: putative NBD/HSP70 family sugar kinase [Kiritimatiellia bacterium]|jgi:predicted NBD/HSP70 family sugar kinase